MDWLNRTEALIGKENILKLQSANIIVFGLGGVGSYVVEGLVRAGVQNICIVDKDVVDITNINRQLIATNQTVGKDKVDAEGERILQINPHAKVIKIKEFVNDSNIQKIMEAYSHIDYVVDAIDTVASKLEIIKYCSYNNINVISSMGTGNKLDASKFEITDIFKTSVCPLAKVMRKELKKLNINSLTVLYSKEEPIKTDLKVPASISFVPSVAGLLIAGKVVKDLIK
jgi:tRNA A37 threonylcarbamoyladenosine dehydratase